MANGAQELGALLLDILHAHPEGLSEYDLLQILRSAGEPEFGEVSFQDAHTLFRVHFLLFHVLYALRERLWQEGAAQLEINPLRIVLAPYRASGSPLPAARDPLRDYYMDLNNLEQTTAAELEAMFDNFWSRLNQTQQRQRALEALGLEDPVDNLTIKRHYRRLAMRHHPDRGGDKAQLQIINAAMEALLGNSRTPS